MLRKSHIENATMLAGGVALVLMAFPLTAEAQDFSVKLETGLTIPLSDPQAEVYDTGGGQTIKALWGLTPYLDLGPTASFLFLPAATDNQESGVVWGLGGGLRLKRPHDADIGVSPWIDADALYVRTGELNRAGFDVAVGLAFPVGETRSYWVGPFVRYLHVFQGDRAGYDNRDAKLLTLGVSVEFGSGIERQRAPEETQVVTEVVTKEVIKEVNTCPDGDQDGVPDSVDRCLEKSGTTDNYGCPNYQKVVVKHDKLELKENIYFSWNSAKLEEDSYPVLDEVVVALKDNKAFRVQLEGHADSTGSDDRNQTLSEKRAQAVRDYLVAHGIEKERLVSKGFSSSVPTSDNKTVDGRGDNRRVEFVVYFIILNDGETK